MGDIWKEYIYSKYEEGLYLRKYKNENAKQHRIVKYMSTKENTVRYVTPSKRSDKLKKHEQSKIRLKDMLILFCSGENIILRMNAANNNK